MTTLDPIAALLIFARVLGLVATAPVLAAPGLEPRFRLVLAIALGVVVIPVVGPTLGLTMVGSSVVSIGVSLIGEAAIGAGLGWAAGLIIAGARQAGELVGAQAGLSAAALFDPEAGDEVTPLGHLYGLVALGAFLAMDGPLGLVRGLIESFEAIPIGGLPLSSETATLAFGRVGHALSLAIRAAAPAAIAMTLASLALGLLGRAAPALPLATLSMPIRYAIGVFLALAGTATLAATIAVAWSSGPFGRMGG